MTHPAAATLAQVATDLSTVADALAQLMTQRTTLAGELARIDDELGRLFELLGNDHRVAVPTMPVPDAVLALTVQTGRRVVPAMHSCQYDVLVAVLAGAETPRDIRLAIPTWSADRVKLACTHLVESGWLRRTGATSNIRYHLCRVSDAAARTA